MRTEGKSSSSTGTSAERSPLQTAKYTERRSASCAADFTSGSVSTTKTVQVVRINLRRQSARGTGIAV
jgi:hypothetical protein